MAPKILFLSAVCLTALQASQALLIPPSFGLQESSNHHDESENDVVKALPIPTEDQLEKLKNLQLGVSKAWPFPISSKDQDDVKQKAKHYWKSINKKIKEDVSKVTTDVEDNAQEVEDKLRQWWEDMVPKEQLDKALQALEESANSIKHQAIPQQVEHEDQDQDHKPYRVQVAVDHDDDYEDEDEYDYYEFYDDEDLYDLDDIFHFYPNHGEGEGFVYWDDDDDDNDGFTVTIYSIGDDNYDSDDEFRTHRPQVGAHEHSPSSPFDKMKDFVKSSDWEPKWRHSPVSMKGKLPKAWDQIHSKATKYANAIDTPEHRGRARCMASKFRRAMRSVASAVRHFVTGFLIPVLIGVAAGMAASLLGMLVGTLCGWIWATIMNRFQSRNIELQDPVQYKHAGCGEGEKDVLLSVDAVSDVDDAPPTYVEKE